MLQVKFSSSPLHLNEWPNDENLLPAIHLIKRWYEGADSFTFYSSGSTGSPKEITLSRTFLIASAKRTIDLFGIQSSDCLLLALNTSFMGGMMMVIRAIVAETTLIYISPQQLSSFDLQQLPIVKLASLVPAQADLLMKKNANDPFQNIQNLLLGGAAISESLHMRLIKLKSTCHFYHTYGMTETASHVAIKKISDNNNLYHALPNFQFSQDERECLIIHHTQDPVFKFTTNDIIVLHSPFSFEWIGRIDWVINSGGIKYSLEKAEECIALFFNEHTINKAFTSYKLPDEIWGDQWILIVEGMLTMDETNGIKSHCKSHLGKYCYPKEILFAKKIVYLSSGKVDRANSFKEAIKPSF
ncbi:MAG TPA: AMP-binding protein [Cytophagaceae bacterium]|jgi:O-succinylbenzoic acid--CoA ligase|nr:AMP-binding protein [Cytophagaceae bacterium]